ncbi:MAG: SAM-dependent methyltransferase [Muribaculum sp.]|nr:SAM-dependent methyltransferase [Muribaculum sp.]
MSTIRRNERDWAGQLISWLKDAINKGQTSFEDATNDTGVRLSSGRTKFPDILLFSDKTSGIIFNGWELKFPDTPVDDAVMLENALEKAQRIKSDSFVTWNGAEAIIWKIDTEHYTVETLSKLKHYPQIPTIQVRADLSNPTNYAFNESLLHERALEILHDLDMLRRIGTIKEAINISSNIIQAVTDAQAIIVPQFAKAINDEANSSSEFRSQFNRWKIYESATLSILGSSSRKNEYVDEKTVLAKFTFYNLIGKILFYLTLSENLPGELSPLSISTHIDLRNQLYSYFDQAKEIDYQAVFLPYFTDSIPFSESVNIALFKLISVLTEFDFKLLPSKVIGNILENLVPKDEKLKFGQYFTSEPLANLVAFPAVKNSGSVLFDPTSGTGTFLNSFYNILRHYGVTDHQLLLDQIWGNDISHFPAILSVINLYKQDVTNIDNFPRVIREDFFNLNVGKEISFPDPRNHHHKISVPIPMFDGIASNFPFIQQEDIPNEKLTAFFKSKFEREQSAFVREGEFHINERADYFAYCVYNALRFIKPNGIISAITSNAWLGKEYGIQFKDFLLNNFHIKYIVRSTAEHWFTDSQVSTIFFVLEKCNSKASTKFVSLNFKMSDYFSDMPIKRQFDKIENFYSQIDNCDMAENDEWNVDTIFPNVYHSKDGSIDVSIIGNETLVDSLTSETNWSQFFVAENPLDVFEPHLTQYSGTYFTVIRGERTGWNDMFIIKNSEALSTGINDKYLIPYVKKPDEFQTILFGKNYKYSAFVCADPVHSLDRGTLNWINKFENMPNRNGSLTVSEANAGHRPFWYSISPKSANIVTAINPYERFFFSYSPSAFVIDQRMIAMQIKDGEDVELIAALLNSVSTFLTLEFMGTSRNLGALDLNANFLKKVRLLNPATLTASAKSEILEAFEPLKIRSIGTVTEECCKADRINFDRTVLRAYGIDESMLESLYNLLQNHVAERVNMKDK